jgi:hypothetical protein
VSWSIGHDSNWNRDIGYGVPAICDHPGCGEKIDRGLGYVCGGAPYGGDQGCGLYFCSKHRDHHDLCARCAVNADPFDATPDSLEWVNHKLTHESWAVWRDTNPTDVGMLRARVEQVTRG